MHFPRFGTSTLYGVFFLTRPNMLYIVASYTGAGPGRVGGWSSACSRMLPWWGSNLAAKSKRFLERLSITPDSTVSEIGKSNGREQWQMFGVGDLVVYPGYGVVRITAIQDETIGDSPQRCYVLETEMSASCIRQIIRLPVRKAEANGMRGIIREEQVPKVLEILRSRETKNAGHAWNKRLREYREAMRTGSIFIAAEIFKDLSLLKESRDLSFSARRLFNEARNLVIQEISIARKADFGDVERIINEVFAKSGTSGLTQKGQS